MLPSEAKDLISIIASGGRKAPKAFGELVQAMLSNTILKDNEKVRCIFSYEENHGILESQKIGMPVGLRDGRFLYLRYDVELSGDKLSVIKSTIQYQRSPVEPLGEIFRYDYKQQIVSQGLSYEERKNQLPESHFHIYADMPDKAFLYKETLDRQHFSCGRVSIESIIRMLIRDFMIKPKVENIGWLDLLDTTEKAFKHKFDPTFVQS